ncbi:hypothetical protein [Micromonospora marina]|uniref:hypothetical protein n=1 Tax=Micromonospora marina TaxID=307120 RepID=UPI003452C31D
MPVMISVLALLVALVSSAVAWRAFDQARTARDIASAEAGPVPDSNRPSPPEDVVTAAPSVTIGQVPDPARSPGERPELNEQTVYEPKYDKQSLTLRPVECYRPMYADLDEPRANVGSDGYDILLNLGCGAGAPYLQLGAGIDASQQARPGLTPQECAEAIRSTPLGAEAKAPARKGVLICLNTSYADARQRGDRWRMVLLEVVAVGNDGGVTIQASAWNIPG